MALLTYTIDTQDKICVEITDIKGASKSNKINELVVMVLRRSLSDLLTLIDTTLYHKYVATGSNWKLILYIKLHKALCVYIWLAPLFYEKLTRDLKAMGFVINLYDPCVENKFQREIFYFSTACV